MATSRQITIDHPLDVLSNMAGTIIPPHLTEAPYSSGRMTFLVNLLYAGAQFPPIFDPVGMLTYSYQRRRWCDIWCIVERVRLAQLVPPTFLEYMLTEPTFGCHIQSQNVDRFVWKLMQAELKRKRPPFHALWADVTRETHPKLFEWLEQALPPMMDTVHGGVQAWWRLMRRRTQTKEERVESFAQFCQNRALEVA